MKKQINNYSKIVFGVLILVFFFVSCKRSTRESVQATVTEMNCPIGTISDKITTDFSRNDTLYPLSEDFLRDFRVLADRYQGTRVTIQTYLPMEWGVSLIERLPNGKELWKLQSFSREWIYLVTVAGAGSERILDILPVAVNIAQQDQELLETEVWTATRDADGSFTVEKTYEWTKSVGDATKEEVMNNPEKFNKKKYVADRYQLNDMGRFDFIQAEEIPDYQAVIFFYKNNEKPETWDETMEIIQSYCEEKNIYFDELYDNFDQIHIRDFKLNDIVTVDLSAYIEECPAGMVMLQNGVTPKCISFGTLERLKIEIKRYFKLLNQEAVSVKS